MESETMVVKEKAPTFKELKVWQKAHLLVLEIYKITKNFPSEEKFGLTSQLRRSVSSIATNIVEGNRRKTRRDYLYFLNLADSSLEETKYHLILSNDLVYIGEENFTFAFLKCVMKLAGCFSVYNEAFLPIISLNP